MESLHVLRREQALGHAGAGIGLENLPGRGHGGIKQGPGFVGLILLEGNQANAQAPEVFVLLGGLGNEALTLNDEIIGILWSGLDVRRLTGGHPQRKQQTQQRAGRGKLHDAADVGLAVGHVVFALFLDLMKSLPDDVGVVGINELKRVEHIIARAGGTSA